MPKVINKILVVNVNWLGDVIFSAPIFKAIKKAYPKATVGCLAPTGVRGVLESIPYVDQIFCYDEKGSHLSLFAKLKLILTLRRERFDIAFLLHRSLTRALLVFLSGIPLRIGYDTKARGFLLTHKTAPLSDPVFVHRSDIYIHVVESFGIPVEDRCPALTVSEPAQKSLREKLMAQGVTESDFVVVVNVGGNWDLKRWPRENFAVLIERLIKEYHAKVIIPGAEKDRELANEIARLSASFPIILAGQTSLKELIALMHRADIVISADTGPLHVAAGIGADVIGLFGPTRIEVTGPRGRGLRKILLHNDVGCNKAPCYYLDCPNNVCMQSIKVDDVLHEIKRIRN